MAVTRMRGIRVPDERWDRGMTRATSEGTNLTAVINDLLEQYSAGEVTLKPETAPLQRPVPA